MTTIEQRAIDDFGLGEVSRKHPHVRDLYVLQACKTLGIEPNEVTDEQRKLAKALLWGRLYDQPKSTIDQIVDVMREGQF